MRDKRRGNEYCNIFETSLDEHEHTYIHRGGGEVTLNVNIEVEECGASPLAQRRYVRQARCNIHAQSGLSSRREDFQRYLHTRSSILYTV